MGGSPREIKVFSDRSPSLDVEGRRRDEKEGGKEGGTRPILGEAEEMVSQVTRLT